MKNEKENKKENLLRDSKTSPFFPTMLLQKLHRTVTPSQITFTITRTKIKKK